MDLCGDSGFYKATVCRSLVAEGLGGSLINLESVFLCAGLIMHGFVPLWRL